MHHHTTYFIFFTLYALNIISSSVPPADKAQSVDTFFVIKKNLPIVDSYRSLIQNHGQPATIELWRFSSYPSTGTLSLNDTLNNTLNDTDTLINLDQSSAANFFTELQDKNNAMIIDGQRCCIFRSPSRHVVQLPYPDSATINDHHIQQCIYVSPTAGTDTTLQPLILATQPQQPELIKPPSSSHQTENKADTSVIQQPPSTPTTLNQQINNSYRHRLMPYAAIVFILFIAATQASR